jgi:site-specific recombinase XerD/ribosomal protein L37E
VELSSIEKAKELINSINTTAGNKEALMNLAYTLVPKTQEFALLRHFRFIKQFFTYLPDPSKDFKDITKREVEEAVAKVIADKSLSDHKRARMFLSVKLAFRYALGDGVSNPQQVAWIKYKSRNKEKLPTEMLTEDDIKKLINSATTLRRDKAIIALLWDAGIRVGELLNLKISDLELSGELAHITVVGKTGSRKIPIAFAVPYLASYLQLRENSKPEDPLFVSEGSWRNLNKRTTGAAITKMLRLAAQRAGIKKHIHPHLFRHSRATNLANKLTEPQMRQFFGWSRSSDMPSVYVHLSGRDLDDNYLRAIGKKPPERVIVQATEKVCARCGYVNPATNLYCARCGMPLSEQEALNKQKEEEKIKEAMLEIAKDPKVFDELIKYLYLAKQASK